MDTPISNTLGGDEDEFDLAAHRDDVGCAVDGDDVGCSVEGDEVDGDDVGDAVDGNEVGCSVEGDEVGCSVKGDEVGCGVEGDEVGCGVGWLVDGIKDPKPSCGPVGTKVDGLKVGKVVGKFNVGDGEIVVDSAAVNSHLIEEEGSDVVFKEGKLSDVCTTSVLLKAGTSFLI